MMLKVPQNKDKTEKLVKKIPGEIRGFFILNKYIDTYKISFFSLSLMTIY